jgi:hypothetical protein
MVFLNHREDGFYQVILLSPLQRTVTSVAEQVAGAAAAAGIERHERHVVVE